MQVSLACAVRKAVGCAAASLHYIDTGEGQICLLRREKSGNTGSDTSFPYFRGTK